MPSPTVSPTDTRSDINAITVDIGGAPGARHGPQQREGKQNTREALYSDTAQFYRLYRDMAKQEDDRILQRNEASLNNCILFAGLLVQPVLSWYISTLQPPEPDYSRIIALFLSAIARELLVNPMVLSTFPSHESLALPPSDHLRTARRLQLCSLFVILFAVQLAILLKEWLASSHIPDETYSPRQWTHLRQFRINQHRKWRVSSILKLPSLLLRVALLVSVMGSILGHSQSNGRTQAVTAGFFIITSATYLLVMFLPVYFPGFPYRAHLLESMRYQVANLFAAGLEKLPSWCRLGRFRGRGEMMSRLYRSIYSFELQEVATHADTLTCDALHWLATSSSLEETFTAVMFAVGAVVPSTPLGKELSNRQMGTIIVRRLSQRLLRSDHTDLFEFPGVFGDSAEAEAAFRALMICTPRENYCTIQFHTSVASNQLVTVNDWVSHLGGRLLELERRDTLNEDTLALLSAVNQDDVGVSPG